MKRQRQNFSKILVVIFALLLPGFEAAAISPNRVECSDFSLEYDFIEQTWVLESYRSGDSHWENDGFDGEIFEIPKDNISFGEGNDFYEFSMKSKKLDQKGNGSVTLLEIVSDWEITKTHELVCTALTQL